MQFKQRLFAALCSVSLLLAGCNGEVTGSNAVHPGVFATINGAAFAATSFNASHEAPGDYRFAASDSVSGYTVLVYFGGIGSIGTYAIGVSPEVGGGIVVVDHDSSTWQTPLTGTAGTVTITAVSDTHITGTFSFTATARAPNANAPVSLTNGAFDLVVATAAGVGALPANFISNFHATVGMTPFHPASIFTNLPTTLSPVLRISVSNTEYEFLFVFGDVNAPGTYSLSVAPIRRIIVTHYVDSGATFDAAWSSDVGPSTGAVTLTSVSSDRVIGTFSATIAPTSGNAVTPIVVSGDFNVGRGFH